MHGTTFLASGKLLSLVAQAAPQSATPQLLDVDGTLFVQLGLFAVTALVLSRFLFTPYLRVKGERISRVEGYHQQAATLAADAAARLTRIEEQLAVARREGAGARALARAEAAAREQTILAEAHAKAQRTLAEARTKLDAALAIERATIAARATEIGREAGKRILGREVQP